MATGERTSHQPCSPRKKSKSIRSSVDAVKSRRFVPLCAWVLAALVAAAVARVDAQDPALGAAIRQLGSLEYPPRMSAARAIRRVPAAQAVPALTEAVTAHPDEYVRFRAFILLSGFNDSKTL